MTSNGAGDQQKNDPMKQTMLIIEHKIRNLEKRKLKLEGYLQQQREGIQLSDDQLIAASKFNEVVSTLDFARNLKKQLSSVLTTTKQKKHNTDIEKLPIKVDSKIKEVLIFQNILQSIKDETVRHDLLTGNNSTVNLSDDELSKLLQFSKMVSPKRRIEEGKALFEDQLKTVSKHYMKLIDSKPNIVVGTSYAHLRECLLKIEKSGYLDHVIKNVDNEVKTFNEVNNLETIIPQIVPQPEISSSDNASENMPVSSVEYTPNKIETIYFTNNNISGLTAEQNPHQNTTDSVFNTSFDFLQDSQLDEEHAAINMASIPTQTFSSSIYTSNGPADEAILKILSTPPQHRALGSIPYKETKINHSENTANTPPNSNNWTEKSDVNWQKRTEVSDNNLPTENWSMAEIISNNTNSDWLVKNNWVQMAEADKVQTTTQLKDKNQGKDSSSNFSLVSNGFTENLNDLLQKSVVFNKQEAYPVVTTSATTNSTYYQNSYSQQSAEHNIGHYTNSNSNYEKNQANDFNKKSVKPKTSSYGGEAGPSRGYQQGNSYVYSNRSYKNSNNQYSNNSNNDYSRISRQT